ncbi:MAG: hypothetical protein C4523_02070 [Myxococcales bacterium]|nr:MAG: hypothetical protein C4523_02070 [Myxococcales bacterium]
MDRRSKIIVFFEDLEIRQEAVHYAAALAKRTNAELIFLLLLRYDSDPSENPDSLRQKYRDVLRHHLLQMMKDDPPPMVEVRVGDPRSEFYKFMTAYSSFEAAVWGGNEYAVSSRAGRAAAHWLAQIENELECPVVVPRRRAGEAKKTNRRDKPEIG